jgi:hypothetical protein
MWHATCTQGNRVDCRLLMVGNQIANLTPDLSFEHNLCFRCPNGSCEPILDIYVSRSFQWYNERLNPMSFDPCNCFLKLRESIETPTPKVGVPLGVWGFIPSHSFALPWAWNVTPEILSWPALLQALALVAGPRLRLRHKTRCKEWKTKKYLEMQKMFNFYGPWGLDPKPPLWFVKT